MMKVRATKNFAMKVAMVDSRIALIVFFLSDSWEMWIHKASLNASAIAIVKIPPMTAIFRCVPSASPTMSPSVVMIQEVMPKANQVLSGCFM